MAATSRPLRAVRRSAPHLQDVVRSYITFNVECASSPLSISPGQSLTYEVHVTPSDWGGDMYAEFYIDGELAARSYTTQANPSGTAFLNTRGEGFANFSTYQELKSRFGVGSHSFTVAIFHRGARAKTVDCGPLTIEEELAPPNLTLTGLSLSPSTTTEGNTVTATIAAENTGGQTGSLSADVTVDGSQVGTVTFDLDGGQSTQKEVTFAAPSPGTYTVTADGQTATLTVEAPADGGEPTEPSEPTEPAGGLSREQIIAGLVALAGVGAVLAR